jgi:hypothetical protein
MKALFFLLMMFTVSACGGLEHQPVVSTNAWNGDASRCDSVVAGACVLGIPSLAVESELLHVRSLFGQFSVDGYLIERVDRLPEWAEQKGFQGLCSVEEKHIWVKTWDGTPGGCDAWLLGHELGHAAIHDYEHRDPVWEVWAAYGHIVCNFNVSEETP